MKWLFPQLRVLIRGAGDLASGVAYRLYQAGIPCVLMERPQPLFVRRYVSFGNALFEGEYTLEGITCQLIQRPDQAETLLAEGKLPLLIDEMGASLPVLNPHVIIDGRMQKQNLGSRLQDAPLVIGMGPGFAAGEDCHAVLETQRGHHLGRVIWQGAAEPDSGTPGIVAGHGKERVLRAPGAGYVIPALEIGAELAKGDLIAIVGDQPLYAPFAGVLRGLIHPSVEVWPDLKIGDLDPRGKLEHCYSISDKALAIGGGAVEAILSAPQIRETL